MVTLQALVVGILHYIHLQGKGSDVTFPGHRMLVIPGLRHVSTVFQGCALHSHEYGMLQHGPYVLWKFLLFEC